MDYMAQWQETIKRIQNHAQFKLFGVRAFKSFETDDGLAFDCRLLYKGKEVGVAHNHGTGGPDSVRIINDDAKKAWAELEAVSQETIEPHAAVLDAILTKHGV